MPDADKKPGVLSQLGQALGLTQQPPSTEGPLAHSKLADFRRYQGDFPGFFSDTNAAIWDVLLEFQATNRIQGHMLEIGVYQGRSALMAALHLRSDEHFLLVDGSPFLRQAKAHLAPHVGRRGVFVNLLSHRLRVEDYASFRRACRWIHIDGEHTGQAVVNDLTFAEQMLHEQGVLVLDDFFNPAYPQLTEAAYAFLHTHRFKLSMFLCGHIKAYLARPLFARRYRQWILEKMAPALHLRNVHDFTLYKSSTLDESTAFGIGERMGNRDWRGLDATPDEIPLG